MSTTYRERYTTTIGKEIIKKFKDLSAATRIPQSKLMDEALEDLLKKYEKESK